MEVQSRTHNFSKTQTSLMRLDDFSPTTVGYRDKWAELFVAIFSATQKIFVEYFGRFMVAEFVAVAGIFRLNVSGLLNAIPELKKIVLGLAVLLFSLLLSDFYNQTPPRDFLRGWASILFGGISIIFLTGHMVRSPRAPYIFLVVTAISSLVFAGGALDLSIQQENSNYFKVRFVPFLIPVLALVASLLWRRQRPFAVLLVFIGGIMFLVFDARSSGGVLILASVLLLGQLLKLRPKLSYILLISSILYGGYVYYVNEVLYHGLGGGNAQQLTRVENPYNPLELLLIGRMELRVTAKAISDHPMVGYGSWAKDKTGEYTQLYAALSGRSLQAGNIEYAGGIIPAHSMFLTAWLWAGLGGAVGFLMVCWTMVRLFLKSYWGDSPLAPLLCIYFVNAVWVMLFSPFGHIRTTFPFIIALLIMALYSVQPEPLRTRATIHSGIH